jgi:hypothetical protein
MSDLLNDFGREVCSGVTQMPWLRGFSLQCELAAEYLLVPLLLLVLVGIVLVVRRNA